MRPILLLTAFLMTATGLFAQSECKQYLGINLAGLVVNNQPDVANSLFYKYQLNRDHQLRLQLVLDGKFNFEKKNGEFISGGAFGGFSQDSSIDFDPGKNIKMGVMAGIQRNRGISGGPFSFYYGLDLMYLKAMYYRSGKGTVAQGNGGVDTTKQRISIKIRSDHQSDILGLGIPLGISYIFGKRYYASLEAKVVMSYQKYKRYDLTETVQIVQFQEFTTRNESDVRNSSINFGIRPVSALTIGVCF